MKYGLIGARLGHSYSCEIHRRIGNYDYQLQELPPEALADFLARRDFLGLNVTIPYKQQVIPLLDEVAEEALSIGAVNTIVNRDGRLLGYNTDLAGMCAAMERGGLALAGKKVLILGTGGTSKTARAAAERLGAAEILRVSRSAKPDAVSYEAARRDHGDAEILINTTPVGMFPHTEDVPIDLGAFPRLEGVMDVIYNPLRTGLLLAARARGIPAVGGLYMLAAQAVYAAALFMDRPVERAAIDRAYQGVLAEKQNIVLIGMAGAGKTTLGRLLAQRTGRAFFDSDAAVVESAGIPIPEIFAREGEAGFRAREREAIRTLAARSGCVIATGGGAVLDPANVRALRQNGRLCFLDRAPEALAVSDDRPLSSTRAQARALYEARYPIYQAAADFRVPIEGSPEACAQAVFGGMQA